MLRHHDGGVAQQPLHDATTPAVDPATATGVDMQMSVLSAATRLGVRAAALLSVWDELPHRSWTDAFSPQEQAAQRRAHALVFDVALGLLRSGG